MVANYDHGLALRPRSKWAVMLVAVPVLFWAANDGDARALAARLRAGDQPSDPELARASSVDALDPYIAIGIAAVLALALAIPRDVRFLARVYAFGALLAVTIAQISIVRLRIVEPDLERPYRGPVEREHRRRTSCPCWRSSGR